MRLLLQRVREGKVAIEGQNVASIGKGLVVLVGFGPEDTLDLRGGKLWNTLIEKMVVLRIFPDDEGRPRSPPTKDDRKERIPMISSY